MTPRLRTACLAVGAAAVAALGSALPLGVAAAAPVHPSVTPGPVGRIVYSSSATSSGKTAIFSVNPDGSDRRQLTDGSSDADAPDVSADGDRIVYYSDASGADELWTMNADGTDPQQLTHDVARDWYPAWSPDGSTIAFRGDRPFPGSTSDPANSDIWTIPATGGQETRLTTSPAPDSAPEYSPDGSTIAFHTTRDDADQTCDPTSTCRQSVYLMNADGSDQRPLIATAGERDRFPNWSPDGSQVVYEQDDEGLTSSSVDGIYVVGADGTGAHQLSGPDQYSEVPDFSPDGTRIAYESGGWGLYTVPVAGGTPRQIVLGSVLAVDWSVTPATHPAAQQPVVEAVYPSDGPLGGGTQVTVQGSGFATATSVRFGGRAATSVDVVSDVELLATAPAGAGAGPVDVTVTDPAGTSATGSGDGFTYDAPPVPAPSLSAASSNPSTLGDPVVVRGSGLDTVTSVAVDGTSVPFHLVDTDPFSGAPLASPVLVVMAPPHAAGRASLSAVGSGGTSAPLTLTYAAPGTPRISSVTPTSVGTAGGATLDLSGTGLDHATSVLVDGRSVPFVQVTRTNGVHLLLTAPALARGNHTVTVAGPSGAGRSQPARLTVATPAPAGQAPKPVPPAATSRTGGATVTLDGVNLLGVTSVRIAGRSVPFTVTPGDSRLDAVLAGLPGAPYIATGTRDAHLTFAAPAHGVGTASVSVVGPGGTGTVSLTYTR